VTHQSTTPALPALSLEPATGEEALQRIALQRSFAMLAALILFVLAATWATYTCAASHLGAWQAVPLTLAVTVLLTLCAIRHERAQPVALRLGRDSLSAWGRAGTLLAHGRIAGCSQWSGRLLVLSLKPEAGRASTLLLAADALPPAVFRELSVLGRRAAGA
jgi:hypothetical protein